MKRYTKEFVNDRIKTALNWYYPCDELTAAVDRVKKMLAYCERGLITDTEVIIETLRAFKYIE